MKLTQRQLDKIAGLISEEAQVRRNLHESMYESRKKSVIEERFLFEGLDLEKMPEQLVAAVKDEIMGYFQNILNSVPKKSINDILYEELSNMYYDMSGRSIEPEVLKDNLDSYNSDEMYSLEVTFLNDILNGEVEAATNEYVLGVGKLAVDEYKSTMTQAAEDDVEPRYSEYE